MKKPDQSQWRFPVAFIVNFERVSYLVLVLLLQLTLSMYLFVGLDEYNAA